MEYLLLLLTIVLFVLVVTLSNRVTILEKALRRQLQEIEKQRQAMMQARPEGSAGIRSEQQAAPSPPSVARPPQPAPPPMVSAPPPSAPPPPVAPAPEQRPTPPPAPPVPPPPGIPAESLSAFRVKLESEAAPPAPTAVYASSTRPTPEKIRSREEWELLIGGSIFNKIGALALVIAAAYAMKLAIDEGLISPTLRIVIGLLVGAALLWGGDVSRRKNLPIFAQGLIAAGIGILYLSVYAAYAIVNPPLVSLPLALLGMFLVTLVAFWQSLRSDSFVVALLGWAGGFLTPLLLRPAAGDPMASTGIGLFTYLVFLEIGLLAVQLRKDAWAALEWLTLVGITALFGFWYLGHAPLHGNLLPVYFLTVFWGLLLAVDFYRALRNSTTFSDSRLLLFAANGALYGLAQYLVLNGQRPSWSAPLFLGIAVIYCLLGLLIAWRRGLTAAPVLRYLLAAAVFLVTATALRYHDFLLVTLWALEGLALIVIGLRWNLNYLLRAALSLFGIALLKLLLTDGALAVVSPEAFTPVWNLRCLAFATLAAACGAGALLFARFRRDGEETIPTMLHYAWIILVFILLTAEINDYFRALAGTGPSALFIHARAMVLAVSWTLYSLPLVWLGLRKQTTPLIYCGLTSLLLGVGAIALMGISYAPIERFTPLLNMRAIPILLVILGLWLESRWLSRRRETHPWVDGFVRFIQTIGALLLFELVTVETIDYFRRAIQLHAGSETAYQFATYTVLPVVWTVYAVALVWYARRRTLPHLLYCAFGAQALGVVVLALMSFEYAPIEAFRPLLNLRAIPYLLVIAGLLAQAYLLGKSSQEDSWERSVAATLRVMAAVLVFELLTVETLDFFRQRTDTSDTASTHLLSMMTLAVIWTLYSLPVVQLGLRSRARGLLYCGLGALVLGVIWLAVTGIGFEPINTFVPLINPRAIAFVLVILGLGFQLRVLARKREGYTGFTETALIFQAAVALLVFELLTAEAYDYFRRAFSLVEDESGGVHLMMHMTLAAIWALFALPVVWIGLRKRSNGLACIGLGALFLAMPWAALQGMRFVPIADFTFLLNYRALAFVLIIISVAVMSVLLHRKRQEFSWAAPLVSPLQVVTALLVLELGTVETWDYYGRLLAANVAADPERLHELRLTMTAVVWLLFSICLLGIGIWQRLRALRVMAIIVFLLSILVICLYYIFKPNTLYRIIAFAVLGLTLLATSFLYQRFRAIILAPAPE